MAGIDSRSKALAQPLVHRHHVVAAAQFKDIDGIFLIDIGDNRHFRSDLADGLSDIGIDRVATIGNTRRAFSTRSF